MKESWRYFRLTLPIYLEARKAAYYPGSLDTTKAEASEDPLLRKISSSDILSPLHNKFMARLTGNFFMFSLRLYLVEAIHLVDTDLTIHTSMHEIAEMRPKNWLSTHLPRLSIFPRISVFEGPSLPHKQSIDLPDVSEEPLPSITSAEISLEVQPVINRNSDKECNQCKANLSVKPSPTRLQRLRDWLKTKKPQVVKAFKVSLTMMLATVFGNWVLPNDLHSCWAPITVSFIIGNLQGGAYRLASLRVQGTALGSIFSYLVVRKLHKHQHALPVILGVWVSLSDYIRYSKTHGYSGLVSALTEAILIYGDFEGKDGKAFAMDRIAMTFIGVFCFIIVESFVLPERAVVLVRQELLKSMKQLRDCVAAVVAVYTSQGCASCRLVAVKDMEKLEEQLRAGLASQKSLRNEAVLEPDLWFVPFPGDVYLRLLVIQNRMLHFLFFMVCALQASTFGSSQEHMQELLTPLRSSLTALEEEVLSTLDTLHKLLDRSVSSWNLLPTLNQVSSLCRKIFHCFRGEGKAPPMDARVRPRRSLDKVFEPSRKASPALLALGHRRRSVGGTPMRLKTTLER